MTTAYILVNENGEWYVPDVVLNCLEVDGLMWTDEREAASVCAFYSLVTGLALSAVPVAIELTIDHEVRKIVSEQRGKSVSELDRALLFIRGY